MYFIGYGIQMHILLDANYAMFGWYHPKMGSWAHAYYWKPKFSDKLALIMMYTKIKDKYKYHLLSIVGPILGGDHIII